MTRVVLRADGSSEIGFGHLSRAATLGLAFQRRGADVEVLLARADPSAADFLSRAGLAFAASDVPIGSEEDAEATRAAGEIVVADGYKFTAAWLEGLGKRVAYIDDWARERFDIAFVINPNVNGERLAYDVGPKTALLAGPSYALVADRFRLARASRVKRPVCDRVLVTMGGSDPPGATLTVIEALDPSLEVRIVVGSANRRREEIMRAVERLPRATVLVDVHDMAAQMSWADMTIAASGVTATELACVGVPGVTFAIVDNQESIAQEYGRLGLFEVLPVLGGGASTIAAAVERVRHDAALRREMVERQHAIVDGEGADRVAARLLA